ncbi:MAG: DUF3846 domain-containing protein [Planctomycetota bacterium]
MTMINVVTINVDGTLLPETIDRGCEALQTRVGGWIEAVGSDDGQVTLWINEEGKLIGLPINELGTELWYMLNPAAAGMDVLCGPVVVSGGCDDEGETLSIPGGLSVALQKLVQMRSSVL